MEVCGGRVKESLRIQSVGFSLTSAVFDREGGGRFNLRVMEWWAVARE